jgi:hypothetical protein
VVSSGIAIILCKFFRGPDVLILRALVAADEQEDDQLSQPQKIYPVAWAVVDSKLRHAIANGFEISRIAKRKPPDAHIYPRNRIAVSEICNPVGESLCLAYLRQA